jgi:hypothetical protein
MNQDANDSEILYQSEIDKGLPSFKELFSLYFKPSTFFKSTVAIGKLPAIVFTTWIVGISNIIDKIDSELLKSGMSSSPATLTGLFPQIVDSWLIFWGAVFALGAASAFLMWIFGGWWYNVRLSWCGADEHDEHEGRIIYIYTSFIAAFPNFLLCIIYGFIFPSYRIAHHSNALFPSLFLVFPFWGVICSYRAVNAVFALKRIRAKIWFLILPVIVYIVALGVIATMVALLSK